MILSQEPNISPEELICLEEPQNGRIVNEKYHLQDFETTQVKLLITDDK